MATGFSANSKHPRIDKITVKGFKCFRDEVSLDIGNLTLLCGRNSSGKSSFLQPALLMKQTYWSPVDAGPLDLDGQNARFDRAAELFWRGKVRSDRSGRIEVGFTVGDLERRHVFRLDSRKHIQLEHVALTKNAQTLTLSPGHDLPESSFDLAAEFGAIRRLGRSPNAQIAAKVQRSRCDARVMQYEGTAAIGSREYGPDLPQILGRWLHVPGFRGSPEREYTAIRPPNTSFPGWFHQYTAGVLREWQEKTDERLQILGDLLRSLELTWKVRVQERTDTRVSLLVGRTRTSFAGGASDLVSIADVGFGVSQVLPVLVALLLAKAGDIVHIEQPELHLHPKAQYELGCAIATVAMLGKCVIVETHSMPLLRGAQATVAELAQDKALDPGTAYAHWFERSDDGAAQAKSTRMLADGSLPDWPEDLAQASLDADLSYLRASLPGMPRN